MPSFGRTGDEATIVVLMVVSLCGAVASWRGVIGMTRTLVAGALFTGAGVVAAMTLRFLVNQGIASAFLPLLMLATAALAVLGCGGPSVDPEKVGGSSPRALAR